MGFEEAARFFEDKIFSLNKKEFLPLVIETGTIPEQIEHDSSEEKLFAKIADIVLAKCFHELGMAAEVIKRRSNCADVLIKSRYHSYTAVADAKAFRLSRTAKNQKDFKVHSLSDWRGDSDFAILVCPFFQYPRNRSQIYVQALKDEVLLFSWEHLAFLLKNNVCETSRFSLAPLWGLSHTIASSFAIAEKEVIFWDRQETLLCKLVNVSFNSLQKLLKSGRQISVKRGNEEILYYQKKIDEINNYSRDEAIAELLKAKKLEEKLAAIRSYISYLENC